MLQRDRRFRLFRGVQLLAGLTTMATPFYVLQARRIGGVAEAEVGTFLAARMLGALALNPLWGWWGDRRGKLDLLRALALASLVSPTLAIVLPRLSGVSVDMTLAGYVVVFFFLGAAAGGRVIADLGFLMEIPPAIAVPNALGTGMSWSRRADCSR